jgi:non-specific serine/threonine protein kinase
VIGEQVSHYRITAKLGEGGMGAVFRADDTKLRRAVALKFLPTDLASDPHARKRLLKEAQVASRLNHPNIATIYEVGEVAGTPFIAMELVEGESLKDMLTRGALPANKLLALARQIADGLEEAHAAGVLHRDLKPANVMVDDKGRVKILDFGLAVLAGRERDPAESPEVFLTRSRSQWSTGGTVPYMPPEQLRGETTDVRGDVFSFGVLLYECLSGRFPFRGENAIDMMHAIVHEPPIPLHTLVPTISLREAFRRAAEPQKQAEKSVAVLYFENLSGEKEDVYFRDGMTEDIITELSKIRELSVFPRSAVLQFRDESVTAPRVAQQLNARYVLEGALRRASNRLRITAQLVETRTGRSIWAERYDRQLQDVFAIQDEIAQSIAEALRVMLTETEKRAIEKKQTKDVQAYDYYLRGRQYFHQHRSKGFDFARQMFARAIVIDPSYARAYAGVADCCSFLYAYWEASDESLKEADIASRKALELDPDLAEAHLSRALVLSLRKRYEEAEPEFETAIRQDPHLYEAYYFYARACHAQSKHEKAARLFQQACETRPEDYQAPVLLGAVYERLGQSDDALMAYRLGQAAAEKHLDLHPDDARALYLGANAMCRLGETSRGIDWLKRAIRIEPEDPHTLYNVACVYSQVRRTDDAIEALEQAVEHGFTHKEWIENDSDLDPLRDHPRFEGLLEKL